MRACSNQANQINQLLPSLSCDSLQFLEKVLLVSPSEASHEGSTISPPPPHKQDTGHSLHFATPGGRSLHQKIMAIISFKQWKHISLFHSDPCRLIFSKIYRYICLLICVYTTMCRRNKIDVQGFSFSHRDKSSETGVLCLLRAHSVNLLFKVTQ